MVHVEDVVLASAQQFHAVLVGVGVDRFLERLAQDLLAAFRVAHEAINAQHEVVGSQGVGGGEDAEEADRLGW